MNIDLDVEPSRPAPDRDEGRDRDVHRSGHRREYDARKPRRSISDRVDGVVRDVGTFRAVALSDVVKRHFDGHTFAAGAALGEAQRQGWIVREKAAGPKGGTFTVIVATPAGAARAAALWAGAGRPDQRVHSGAVKASEMRHEVAVYRAASAAHARIEAAGGRVVRVRIDAELKGQIAARAERARQAAGRMAATERRRRAAAELSLPVEKGRVLFPDAQLEYVTAAGLSGRCNVEVASEHYSGGAIRAKAAAGFQMYAPRGQAAAVVRRALAGMGPGAGSSRKRGGGHRRYEVFEL